MKHSVVGPVDGRSPCRCGSRPEAAVTPWESAGIVEGAVLWGGGRPSPCSARAAHEARPVTVPQPCFARPWRTAYAAAAARPLAPIFW